MPPHLPLPATSAEPAPGWRGGRWKEMLPSGGGKSGALLPVSPDSSAEVLSLLAALPWAAATCCLRCRRQRAKPASASAAAPTATPTAMPAMAPALMPPPLLPLLLAWLAWLVAAASPARGHVLGFEALLSAATASGCVGGGGACRATLKQHAACGWRLTCQAGSPQPPVRVSNQPQQGGALNGCRGERGDRHATGQEAVSSQR